MEDNLTKQDVERMEESYLRAKNSGQRHIAVGLDLFYKILYRIKECQSYDGAFYRDAKQKNQELVAENQKLKAALGAYADSKNKKTVQHRDRQKFDCLSCEHRDHCCDNSMACLPYMLTVHRQFLGDLKEDCIKKPRKLWFRMSQWRIIDDGYSQD